MSGQWRIEKDGLDSDGYFIHKSRLLELRDGLYEWPLHLCIKTWIDFDNFAQVFVEAMDFYSLAYDPVVLAATVARCRKRIAESEEYDAVSRELFPERYDGKLHWFWPGDFQRVQDEIERRRSEKAAA